MKIISKLNEIKINDESVVAIGKFDGVHKGHRALIDELLRIGKENNLKTVIFSFSPSPAEQFWFCLRKYHIFYLVRCNQHY